MNIVNLKCALAALMLISFNAYSGIVIGGTRFVFPQESETLVVALRNTEKKPFLMKSKIVNDEGLSTTGITIPVEEPQKPPFVATPPVIIVNGEQEQQLKIIYTGGALPVDRESLFWLSVSAIPPSSPTTDDSAHVKIAVNQQVKLLWRPAGLPELSEAERKPLRWQRQGKRVTVSNDTPWYVTLSSLRVNGKNITGGMVPPYNQRNIDWCPASGRCEISWQMLEDDGQPLQIMRVAL
ncbi:molecular chaperone [Enterobacter sp. ENT03]|uniref:fimbrial biogenesis chaperone n=1 Tax=Enterobacter sp. ENT03 TaxID=2854780 RepID=UPI001C44D5C5|nr:molecular chaperone [Enterobacter sp. ENT03]MBV7403499.1 molecular chaperone [Enterobacter sp. ENT03]